MRASVKTAKSAYSHNRMNALIAAQKFEYMVLQNLLEQPEIDLIIDALEKRQTFWRSVANRPITGYGRASELVKRERAGLKAEEIRDLLSKIVEITI